MTIQQMDDLRQLIQERLDAAARTQEACLDEHQAENALDRFLDDLEDAIPETDGSL